MIQLELFLTLQEQFLWEVLIPLQIKYKSFDFLFKIIYILYRIKMSGPSGIKLLYTLKYVVKLRFHKLVKKLLKHAETTQYYMNLQWKKMPTQVDAICIQ